MNQYKRLKFACYGTNLSMSVISNLSPLLFLTFRTLYGISYSLLGLLVVINFFTQLIIDLIFSFFSHKFSISKAVKITPLLTISGLLIYGASPFLFRDNIYLGLVLGTIIFSASGGFTEVLISPVIAAIPSDDPKREMSKLHSVYAWGVVAVVILCTVFLLVFGKENWQWLAFVFTLVPFYSAIMYHGTEIPDIGTPEKTSGALSLLKNRGIWICVAAIFLGGGTECIMAQWCSGYIEGALGIPKVWGDIFGVALFSLMLALGRSLYAKFGRNISLTLLFCTIGATICYFVAAVSLSPIVGIIACVMTGLCASMLWPGSLIVASDRFQKGGVFIFALMAAGGDFGASVGPQAVGLITDIVMGIEKTSEIAAKIGITPEQLGMKAGMLSAIIFPLSAVFVYTYIVKKWSEV